MALFFGVGGVWAAAAPLASASMASGSISPEGLRRTVQHLEGGIIKTIHVRNGDQVEAGQALVTLESTQARASYRMQESRYTLLRATEARLLAEQFGAREIDWSKVPEAPDREEVMEDQQQIFLANARGLEQETSLLNQRIRQLEEEIGGYRAQMAAQGEQADLLAEEIDMLEQLLAMGLVRRPQLLELKRRKAETDGARSSSGAAVARAQQMIGEARMEINGLQTRRRQEAANQLGEVRGEIARIEEAMTGAGDVLERTVITAPISGVVFDLAVNTPGGVIPPGESLLDLVPVSEKLMIDARVPILDIDDVHTGLEAQVTLSALPQRNLPKLTGRVVYVSADRMVDEATGEPFYSARVEISADTLAKADLEEKLIPGMPADVMIFIGTRTMADYLFTPLIESINRSFIEA